MSTQHRWFTLSCEYLRDPEKIRKGPNGILSGLGETDSWKKPEVENLVALSFRWTFLYRQNIVF
jgi:hypothetical protein